MDKEKGLKLFGVRIEAATATAMVEEEEEVMRKSQSMGNLCAANQSSDADHGYLSDGGLAQNSRSRARQERKRGTPWTEEEHRTFLAGLEKLGKGDWRGISRNFVTTRTPTQVASHAQKYFLRQSNPNKKKRRSSLFDVGINDNATPPPTETPIQLSPKKFDTAADRTANHLMNAQSLVAAPMVTRGAEAFQPLTLATNNTATPTLQNVNLLGVSSRDQVNSRFYGNPATLAVAPDFLQLSLPNYVPVHESVKAPSVDSSDLELSIAPPQPHPVAKLPPHRASGAIRVI